MLFVKSKFKRRFKGIVLKEILRSKRDAHLYLVLVLVDSNGNIPKRRMLKLYGTGWFDKIEPIEIEVPEKWLFSEYPRDVKNAIQWYENSGYTIHDLIKKAQ